MWKQTCADQRISFKAYVAVGEYNGHAGVGVKYSQKVTTTSCNISESKIIFKWVHEISFMPIKMKIFLMQKTVNMNFSYFHLSTGALSLHSYQ